MKTMFDLFPDFVTGGIFSVMINPPWLGSINGADLDFNYFTKFGMRLAGGVTLALAGGADKMPPEGTAHAARLLQARYNDKWTKLWHAITVDYNPIENYSMTEEGTDGTIRHDEQTVNTTDDLTYTGSEQTKNKSAVYGFDSASPSDSDESTTDKSFANRQDNRLVVDDKTGDSNETTTHKFKRSGNIGVLTATEMVEKEIDVRNKLDYFNIVFKDVNDMLTLPIY